MRLNPEHTQKRRKTDAHTHTTHSGGTTTQSSGRTAVSPVQEKKKKKKQRLEQRHPRAHMHTLTSSQYRPHGNRHHRRTNHSAPAQHMLPCYLEECIYICVTSAHAAKQTRIHSLHPTRYPFGSESTPSAHPIRQAGEVCRPFLAEKLALRAVLCAKESSGRGWHRGRRVTISGRQVISAARLNIKN